MKIGWLSLALLTTGCVGIGALAPDYAIGSYRGAVIARGACAAPGADLTVSIGPSSASGDLYFEQQNIRARFGDGWVDDAGFLSSRRTPDGMEYVSGYFVDNGAALDATIDTRTCTYVGTLVRV
jgi:hypothetical protein